MLIIIGRDIMGSGARIKRGQELDKKTKYRMYESPPASGSDLSGRNENKNKNWTGNL
jgi:hypothetical protein